MLYPRSTSGRCGPRTGPRRPFYKYVLVARQLIAFLTGRQANASGRLVKREHIEAYLEALLEESYAGSASAQTAAGRPAP